MEDGVRPYFVWAEMPDGSKEQIVTTLFSSLEQACQVALQLGELNRALKFFVSARGEHYTV